MAVAVSMAGYNTASEDETASIRSARSGGGTRGSAFAAKVKAANEAVRRGDLAAAARLYSDGLALDPSNYVVYGNRCVVRMRLGQYEQAASDARKARLLKPSWVKVSL